MDSLLKSSLQEIIVLKEEKEKLSATLIAFEESSADAIETAKEEGYNEATAVYEVQFTKLENVLFEDGWMAALQVANVLLEFEPKKNIAYLRPNALEKPSEEIVKGAGTENPYAVE
ncbi:uncharacterized protein LOC114258729 [Camellia sinensis]|uniref:uncharacterized protein LOC114258729 n=1 Tax=Camellia sinensis TaxID=4442 RepID=UPI001036B948|nr:uncharacterized protein LOC114258729 [Camellia sinensis]